MKEVIEKILNNQNEIKSELNYQNSELLLLKDTLNGLKKNDELLLQSMEDIENNKNNIIQIDEKIKLLSADFTNKTNQIFAELDKINKTIKEIQEKAIENKKEVKTEKKTQNSSCEIDW